MVGVIVFLVVLIPAIGMVLWYVFDEAFVRVEPGSLGLVLVRGKATDRALEPGPHFVPLLRRMMVQVYPSREMSYRGSDAPTAEAASADLEYDGPPLLAVLGDRTKLRLAYTVRFRLDRDQLRTVHERVGPDGLWANVRDKSASVLRATLGDPECGVDSLFGTNGRQLERTLEAAVAEVLASDGFVVTFFSLGDVDLGRTGEVIQAIARARLELEREEAEAATRTAQARIDSELQPYFEHATNDFALRYREVDVWRDIVNTPGERNLAMPAPTPGAGTGTSAPGTAAPADSATPAPPASGGSAREG